MYRTLSSSYVPPSMDYTDNFLRIFSKAESRNYIFNFFTRRYQAGFPVLWHVFDGRERIGAS